MMAMNHIILSSWSVMMMMMMMMMMAMMMLMNMMKPVSKQLEAGSTLAVAVEGLRGETLMTR